MILIINLFHTNKVKIIYLNLGYQNINKKYIDILDVLFIL